MDEGERKMKCNRGRFTRRRRKKGIGEERSWKQDCESRGERQYVKSRAREKGIENKWVKEKL